MGTFPKVPPLEYIVDNSSVIRGGTLGNVPLYFFDDDGGAVAQNFGHSAHDFRRVVANPDNGIGADFLGVGGHHLEGVRARLLAQLSEQGDVASDQGLEGGADSAEHRPGPDKTHESNVACPTG